MSKSPRRRRTEHEALEFLNDNAPAMPTGAKQLARARIKIATQPNREARRIVEQARKAKAAHIDVSEEIDLSDVQALWAQLIKRDGVVGSPHLEMLSDISYEIITGRMSAEEFRERAALILSIESALPKEFREREREFIRKYEGGGW